ncbi:MAG: peptidoglycan DD-metalloendopeptidase family protein [Clostridiales bacterium]|jgi:murein DD-endopeptidase MepM/ murein hydrolase activator NlpD|nr:peptidoglycan DD-metalloendopeptidase family protein [Clostridiales bacterium]
MDGQYLKQIIADTIIFGFNSLKSSALKNIRNLNRHNIGRFLSVICLCSVFIISAANINFAYAVSYDGEILCYARDWSKLQVVIDKVEKIASEALGYDFSLDSELTTRLSIGSETTTEHDELETLLLDSIPEIKYLYAVLLDGNVICAFEDKDSANAALVGLVNGYITDKTVAVEFDGEVAIEQKYVSSDLLVDQDSALKFLAPNINVITQELKTVEETIAHDTEYVEDSSLVVGKTITKNEGINGRALVEYKTTCVNGAIKTTEAVEHTVITEPVSAVILKGTREKISTGEYQWPCTGEISSGFGYRSISIGSRYHKGIDIADDYGTAIYASDGGIVTKAEYYCGYGKIVIIEHDNGDLTYYAHLSSMDVEVGDLVNKGDCIGAMGSTGTASGTHLHFEIRPGGGEAVDPLTILP